jgi:hypothetical protein
MDFLKNELYKSGVHLSRKIGRMPICQTRMGLPVWVTRGLSRLMFIVGLLLPE